MAELNQRREEGKEGRYASEFRIWRGGGGGGDLYRGREARNYNLLQRVMAGRLVIPREEG